MKKKLLRAKTSASHAKCTGAHSVSLSRGLGSKKDFIIINIEKLFSKIRKEIERTIKDKFHIECIIQQLEPTKNSIIAKCQHGKIKVNQSEKEISMLIVIPLN